MSPTCRRHVSMSPNLGRHCVRETRMPNLYQLQPTSTNQPKRTGTVLWYIFCVWAQRSCRHERHVGKSRIVVSFWTPCRHDIFLCLRHDQRRVATCCRHDTECRRLGNKNDTLTSNTQLTMFHNLTSNNWFDCYTMSTWTHGIPCDCGLVMCGDCCSVIVGVFEPVIVGLL